MLPPAPTSVSPIICPCLLALLLAKAQCLSSTAWEIGIAGGPRSRLLNYNDEGHGIGRYAHPRDDALRMGRTLGLEPAQD